MRERKKGGTHVQEPSATDELTFFRGPDTRGQNAARKQKQRPECSTETKAMRRREHTCWLFSFVCTGDSEKTLLAKRVM